MEELQSQARRRAAVRHRRRDAHRDDVERAQGEVGQLPAELLPDVRAGLARRLAGHVDDGRAPRGDATRRPSRDLVRRFPSVSVFNVDDLLRQVRSVIDKALAAVQSVFLFTLMAGLVVLIAAVQASREERRYESAMLRTLGRESLAPCSRACWPSSRRWACCRARWPRPARRSPGVYIAKRVLQIPYTPDPWVWFYGLVGGGLLVVLRRLAGDALGGEPAAGAHVAGRLMAEERRRQRARWSAGTTRACWRTRPTRSPSPTSSAATRTRGSSRRSPASRRTSSTTPQRERRFLARLRRGHRRRLEFHLRRRRCHRAARARRCDHGGRPRTTRRRPACWCSAATRSIRIPSRSEYDARTETPYRHGLRGPRASRRVRDSRQPRLVRQPGRVLAHVLPARSAASPAAPRARRAATSRSNYPRTGGCSPSTCSSAPISTSRRCSTSRRSPRAWTTRARLIFCVPEPRWILEDAYPQPLELRGAVEHALSRREGLPAQGARVPHRRPAFLQAPRKRRRHPEDHLGRRRRVPAPDARARRRRSCATASCSAPRIRTRKPRARLAWRNFLFPLLNPEVRLAVRVPLRDVGVAGLGEPRGRGRHRSADRARMPPSTRRSAIRSTACGWSAIIGGFIFFTDTHVRSWRILGGAFHALMHLAAAFAGGLDARCCSR